MGIYSSSYIGEESLSEETIINFINEDIRYYFNTFYTFDERDTAFEFPLFLVIMWTLNDPELQRSITGMHEIPFASNHYLLSRKKPTTSSELPLSMQVNAPSKLEHNFIDYPYTFHCKHIYKLPTSSSQDQGEELEVPLQGEVQVGVF